MKKILPLLFLFVSFQCFAQITDELKNSDWPIGASKEMHGYIITRLEGINDAYGATNIAYKPLEVLIADIEKLANKEMWTKEEKEKKISDYKFLMASGWLLLYVKRNSIESADFDKFTVVVHDANENEILRTKLKADIPNYPGKKGELFWNYKTLTFNQRTPIEGDFYVYVVDRYSPEYGKFKFKVSKK
jgi:hypothetical protein